MIYKCKICGMKYDNFGNILTHLTEHDIDLLKDTDTPIEIVKS